MLCLWEDTFFQTWICMAMIFEPYLGCYSSIFSQHLVCCSREYGLGKVVFNFESDVGNVVKFSIHSVEAYHLNLSAWQITSSEKLFLYEIYTNNFSTNFVARLSQKRTVQSSSNFLSIFVIIRNRQAKLFSVITQPWRHPGAILWIHIIIHISITIHHKLTKSSTHKLHVISQ